MMKSKLPYSILAVLAIISLAAAGCSETRTNDLQRPAEPTQESSSSQGHQNSDIENGEVAGTETVELPKKKVLLANQEVEAEVADNDASREQGLSGRKELLEGQGMLFDFTNTDFKKPGFWMKDMLINIDIIWINNGKIVGIESNVPLPPEDDDLPVYYPPSEVTHVLEVPAGWSTKNNVVVGESVTL